MPVKLLDIGNSGVYSDLENLQKYGLSVHAFMAMSGR